MRGVAANSIKGGAMWDDLRSPASGINPAGSPSAATPSTVDGSLTFVKGNAAIAWFQIPHAWKKGTDISIHIHWSKSTSAAGNVNWQIKSKWFNIGAVAPAFSPLTTGTLPIAEGTPTADKHLITEFPDLSGAGKTLSSMICVYLERVNDGVDTYTPAVNLYEIDIHYQVDSLGSDTEYVKYE